MSQVDYVVCIFICLDFCVATLRCRQHQNALWFLDKFNVIRIVIVFAAKPCPTFKKKGNDVDIVDFG